MKAKTKFRNLSNLKIEALESEELLNQIRENPRDFITELRFEKNPLRNPTVFTFVISGIGLLSLICILFIGFVVLSDVQVTREKLANGTIIEGIYIREIPEILGVIATSALSAIAGLLAPSPLRNPASEN